MVFKGRTFKFGFTNIREMKKGKNLETDLYLFLKDYDAIKPLWFVYGRAQQKLWSP